MDVGDKRERKRERERERERKRETLVQALSSAIYLNDLSDRSFLSHKLIRLFAALSDMRSYILLSEKETKKEVKKKFA